MTTIDDGRRLTAGALALLIAMRGVVGSRGIVRVGHSEPQQELHVRTIEVPRSMLETINRCLERVTAVRGRGDESLWRWMADFGDGLQADIEVINGNGPWVNAVLFKDGNEVVVLEPGEGRLDGEYDFEYGGVIYRVIVKGVS